MISVKGNITRLRPHNLKNLKRDVGYRFTIERDPDLEWIAQIIQESELPSYVISDLTAKVSKGAVRVATQTIDNWCNGKTRRPQNFTISWVALALGYERTWVSTTSKGKGKGIKMSERKAPEGTIWVCAACGKTSLDRWQGPNGWDESCATNAVLCERGDIIPGQKVNKATVLPGFKGATK